MVALATRGHPQASAALARAALRGRVPHALLLVGPRHVGKTTLALDLARQLLCSAPMADDRPCGGCPGCRKVEHGNHPDLHRLAPEGAGDQVRLARIQALIGELALHPMEGAYRIAIVEAAHRLNQDAQNALLKTLEEPPARTLIVLCTDDESLMLPTIRSRCARFRLRPLPAAAVDAVLAEQGVADSGRASAAARLSGGRPGLALSVARSPESALAGDRLVRALLDLLWADRRRRLRSVAELMTDGAVLDAALGERATVVGGDSGEARRAGRSALTPSERRAACLQVLAAWQSLARDLVVVTSGTARGVLHLQLLEELRSAAAAVPRSSFVEFLSGLDALRGALESYANPELLMDVLVLRWPASPSEP